MARSMLWESAGETGKEKRKKRVKDAMLVDQRYLIDGINFVTY